MSFAAFPLAPLDDVKLMCTQPFYKSLGEGKTPFVESYIYEREILPRNPGMATIDATRYFRFECIS
jgi:hypothetical protein